ncbi:plasmid maintenance protein CcdB [Sulfitobacter sp. M57]|uniref:CcdB family protein n=1 Tax=unclassified Sulfitobacter TaxID=196795 RepID=UPI0023E0E627|nr:MULTISPECIES: CcdB family protein [unclassified Sulfitobacter]MDF3416023.1 plasmid maintenance protein CcdB [Sulfitobacter sp. KE5]MDF3423503.1 plasmid maintenance protein CcdB [Sulfitobacter sp. KE43]MDF3434696.1 plasmid maintenance protein CcdB [Sulfitobacter sp. KE42]MDF3460209.1 plasmid maintenance protein CcdB [Sulfitobacter sp. S74]MDF3464233.1 plasmid maintenance protein CcdB [Sulfitobacter sp. Ks18]
MSRFDLYQAGTRDEYLLDLQSDFLVLQGTRMVAPVLPVAVAAKQAGALHPEILIEGRQYCLVTHLMAAVPQSVLRQPVANLSDQSDVFTRALDILFQGY